VSVFQCQKPNIDVDNYRDKNIKRERKIKREGGGGGFSDRRDFVLKTCFGDLGDICSNRTLYKKSGRL